MAILASRAQIAIKQEAVAGTAEVLAAGNVILTTDLPTFESEIETAQRAATSASLSGIGHVVGARSGRIGFKMHLRGTSVAPVQDTTFPDFRVPFLGCGAKDTVSGGSPNEQTSFKPLTSLVVDESTGAYCTVAIYRDGKEYKIHGAVGNCVLTFKRGSPVMADFTFTGVYNTPTDVALLSPSYGGPASPPQFLGASLTILGFATPKIDTLTLDFGNEIGMRPYPNSAAGFLSAQIVRRAPKGTFDPEEELAATKNWHNEFIAGTTGAIQTGVFPTGGTNYNQLSLTIPKAQYSGAGHGDRDGIVTTPIEFVCNRNSDAGNDEWELIQT